MHVIVIDTDAVKGTNGYEQFTKVNEATTNRKSSVKNIVHINPGPVVDAPIAKKTITCFNLFISDEIRQEIVTRTNDKIV